MRFTLNVDSDDRECLISALKKAMEKLQKDKLLEASGERLDNNKYFCWELDSRDIWTV
jgi:hypothetical protein